MKINLLPISLFFIACIIPIYLASQDQDTNPYETDQNNVQWNQQQPERKYTQSTQDKYYNPYHRNNHRYDYSNPHDYYFNRQSQFTRIPD